MKMSIVFYRVEMSGLRFTGRDVKRDGNWYPDTEPCPKAVAMVYSHDSSEIEKAEKVAAEMGYKFAIIPYGNDILDRARALAVS